MNEQAMLNDQVQRWQAAGQWTDCGRWVRGKRGALIYRPTKCEIRAKCRLFRALTGWRGAGKRAPRGGEFAVATTAGI